MSADDLDEVLALERACFGDPWSRASFEAEVADPEGVRWPIVAVRSGRLVGYILVWFILDEAHIANIAVAPMFRFLGLGSYLLRLVIDQALDRSIRWIGLEVRESNEAARALYQRHGFRVTGRRPRYYSDNREDALIMTLALAEEA